MPTSPDNVQVLTREQAVQLRRDLTLIEERLQDIASLLRVCYGDDSQPAMMITTRVQVSLKRDWMSMPKRPADSRSGLSPERSKSICSSMSMRLKEQCAGSRSPRTVEKDSRR